VRKHNQQITFYLGRTDTSETQGDIDITLATDETTTADQKDLTDIKYIPVRFKSCTINQEPGNTISITLDGVRTA
jgi:hypothetical protein